MEIERDALDIKYNIKILSHSSSYINLAISGKLAQLLPYSLLPIFPHELGEIIKRAFYLGVSEEISNFIPAKFYSTFISSSNLNESRGLNGDGPGSPKNAAERCHKTSSVQYKSSSKFSFCNSEKEFRSSASDKLEETKLSHSLFFFFKMEGLFLLKEDYMCKIDLKDAYFSPTRF